MKIHQEKEMLVGCEKQEDKKLTKGQGDNSGEEETSRDKDARGDG